MSSEDWVQIDSNATTAAQQMSLDDIFNIDCNNKSVDCRRNADCSRNDPACGAPNKRKRIVVPNSLYNLYEERVRKLCALKDPSKKNSRQTYDSSNMTTTKDPPSFEETPPLRTKK